MYTFVKSAVLASEYPKWSDLATREVAFIGRSNVGKSSLINALANQRALARVSHTPGRTQLVNFFQDGARVLVDLPGYGYARASHEQRLNLSHIINTYLTQSAFLHHVFLLIDARLGFLPIDVAFLEQFLLPARFSWSIVFTKSDKASQKMRTLAISQANALAKDYLFVASRTNLHIHDLRRLLFSI